MSKSESLNSYNNDNERDLIINQLKDQIYEEEQKINNLICVEEYNTILKEENENLKNELNKIINDYEYLKVGFEKLLDNNKIIQNENKKLLSQINDLEIENLKLENENIEIKTLFDNCQKENEENIKEINSLNEEINNINNDYKRLKIENDKYNEIINEIEFNKINENYENINQDYNNLKQEYIKINLTNNKLIEENNELNENYKKVLNDINQLNNEIEKQEEMNKLNKEMFEKEINNLNNIFQDKITNLNIKYESEIKNLKNNNYKNIEKNNKNKFSKSFHNKDLYIESNNEFENLNEENNIKEPTYRKILNYKIKKAIPINTENNFIKDNIYSKINYKIKSPKKLNIKYDTYSFKENNNNKTFSFANTPKNSDKKNQNNSINNSINNSLENKENYCSNINPYTNRSNYEYFENSTYQSSNKKNSYIEKIIDLKNYFVEENKKLKQHILLLTNQNQNLMNELETIVSSSEFSTIDINHHGINYLNDLLNKNKLKLEKSLDDIEKTTKRININYI